MLFITLLEYLFLDVFIGSLILSFSILIEVFIYSYTNGKRSSLKGYKEGLKSGIKVCLILLLIKILSFTGINATMAIYFLIIIMTSILGGIIGKNKSCSR